MAVHYEVDGALVVVTLDRKEVANAIDRPTADALADAFRRFDADPSLSVSVLTGAGGKFCCGADLKAMRGGDPEGVSRVTPAGDGPGGRARARRVVRPPGGGGGCGVRRLLPALGHPADGRWDGASRAADRPQPRPRSDPH